MQYSTPTLSVVIPAYNEAERLGPTLRAMRRWLATRYRYEIIVVDDGSTDGTARMVSALHYPELRLIESRPNRGKGYVVRLGMLAARGELRLFADADGSVAIEALEQLAPKVAAGSDIAIASRRAIGAEEAVRPPCHRRVWSRVANRVVRAGLIDGIVDTQCGFKLLSAAAAEQVFPLVETAGWGFDLEVLGLAQRLGLTIAEVPVCWRDDPRTRIQPIRDAIKITAEFLRIRRRLAHITIPTSPRQSAKMDRWVDSIWASA